jgi:hypothetical protein
MIRPSLIAVSLFWAGTVASAFSSINITPRKPSALTAAPSRRELLRRTAGLGVLSLALAAPPRARAEVRRSPGKCVHGEGDGCDSLAADNAFIQSLQQKSADNREANERVRNGAVGVVDRLGPPHVISHYLPPSYTRDVL